MNTPTSLYRPDKGRWIAGVSAGLSLRFGVPVWLIRIVFAVACYFSLLGMLLYAAGWLLLPREGETEAILQRWMSGSIRRRIGVILAGGTILAVCSATGLIRGGITTGVGLIGIGTIFYGGYLSRGHRPPAALPAPPAATAPASPKKRPARIVVGVALITLGTLGLFYTVTTVIAGLQPEPHHYITVAIGVIGFCMKPRPTTPHPPHPVTPVHSAGAV